MATITQEEENFVRQSMLLTGIAPRAVRVLFDREFPPPLHQLVTKNLIKLNALYTKRVINSAQWTILNAANPVSTDLDITLMICLIRNFSSIPRSSTGFDNLPFSRDNSECADLARIKCYRNNMAHMENNKISQSDFTNEWREVSEAVGRLGGSKFVTECQNLMTTKLDQSNQEIMTEMKTALSGIKELQDEVTKSQVEIKSLQEEIDKIRKEKQDIIPKNTLVIMESTKREYQVKLEKFVVTQSAKFVVETLQNEQCVIIVGESGSGKSALAYYAAFYLEENEKFEILPVTSPSEIITFTIPNMNQLFLFDDVIGKYVLLENDINEWEKLQNNLEKHLKTAKNIKILMTCRSNIYDKIPNKRLGLSLVSCDLSSDTMGLSLVERKQIAQSYLTEDCVNQLTDDIILMYPFFPFLCQMQENTADDFVLFFEVPNKYIEMEISKLAEKCDPAYFCLALLVIFDNCVDAKLFTISNNNDYKEIFEDLFNESKFKQLPSKAFLHSNMKQLTKTYLKEINNSFSTVHDKLFDIISYFIGQNFKQCLIKHGSSSFIKDRLKFSSIDDGKSAHTILLETSQEAAYFKRILQDMRDGENWTVFGNCQTHLSEYRKKFIEFIITKKKSDIVLCPRKIDHVTGLHVSALLGYTDFCVLILKFDETQISFTDDELWTPLHYSTFKGHIDVTELLLIHKATVNQQDNDGWTPLKLACDNGHKDVIKLLLAHRADVDKADIEGWTPLKVACLNGYKDVVELLIAHHADVNKADNEGWTPLHTACSEGYKDIVELLLIHQANVNQQEEDGWTPLKLSCQNGHKDVAELLLTHQADVDKADYEGWTPLHKACSKGYTDISELLLTHKANVNKQTINGWTPLEHACQNRHKDVVELLITHHADVDKADNEGWTPLKLACLNGHKDVVELLLAHHAVVDKVDNTGWTPLHTACIKGYKDIAELLLIHKANVNYLRKDGQTTLRIACQTGRKDVVELLLSHHADADKADNEGWTPLHTACSEGYKDIAELILTHKANVNRQNKNGNTPLKLACQTDHKDVVKLLLTHQADVDKADNGELTPLHTACSKGYKDIAELLLTHKANVNRQNKNGNTPLKLACQTGHKDVVELLLTHQADVDKADTEELTPLHTACSKSYKDIAELLLTHKANVNRQNKNGNTPLKLACQTGHKDVVELLLTHQADVDKADKEGWTPLHWACSNGYKDIAELLLTHKANVNRQNKNGTTPLKLACENGHKDVVELLLTHRADVDKADNDELTPLHTACSKGYTDIVKLLLPRYMNQQNKYLIIRIKQLPSTPKCIPYINELKVLKLLLGHKDIVELSLTHQAGMAYNREFTPLNTAFVEGYRKDLLMTHQANVNPQNKKGNTITSMSKEWP